MILGVALALTASALTAQASVLDGPGEDLPVLVDERFEGAAAVSVTLELSGPALYRIDVIGDEPRTSTTVSTGFVDYNETRAYDGMVVVTGFESRERHRTVVAGEALPAPAIDSPSAGGNPLSVILPSEDERERTCPLACASRLEQPDRTEAGTRHHAVWVGGVGETRLQVIGDGNVTGVEVRYGSPVIAGSEDFQDGAVNVQHQPAVAAGDERVFAGAKAMHEARYEASLEDRLFGVVGLAEFKTACAGTCVTSDTVRAACRIPLSTDCRAAQVTWEGPDTSGEASHHVFRGAGPGDYAFGVERAVDGYASPTPVVAGYAYADPGEHHAYVSAAELPRPAPSADTR